MQLGWEHINLTGEYRWPKSLAIPPPPANEPYEVRKLGRQPGSKIIAYEQRQKLPETFRKHLEVAAARRSQLSQASELPLGSGS